MTIATVYGTNATTALGQSRIPQGEVCGAVRVAYDVYTASGVIADATVIRLCKIPAKARILDVVLSHTDLGTTGSCKVGWESNGTDSADDDGFLTSVDLNAAANTVSIKDEANVPGMFKQFAADTQVSITMTAATTAAGSLKLAVIYVIE